MTRPSIPSAILEGSHYPDSIADATHNPVNALASAAESSAGSAAASGTGATPLRPLLLNTLRNQFDQARKLAFDSATKRESKFANFLGQSEQKSRPSVEF